MYFVEHHQIKNSPEIDRLSRACAALYNRMNYGVRQVFFSNRQKSERKKLPNTSSLWHAFKADPLVEQIGNSKTACQVMKMVQQDWSGYFDSLKAYKKQPALFKRCPRPPAYKKDLCAIIFYAQTIKRGPLKQGIIEPTNGLFRIKSNKPFKQVKVTPKTFGYVVEVQYQAPPALKLPKTSTGIACVDLGLNNLMTVTSDKFSPILVNGRPLKAINQWFNKSQAKRLSAKAQKKRYWQIENYFHQTSRRFTDLCVSEGIGQVVIGLNKGWKTSLNLGRKTNQAFSGVPFGRLNDKLKYKLEQQGIVVTFTEEAYTSKGSFIDRDPLPAYEKGKPSPAQSGKRVHRGLYRSANGTRLNADVNGSLNIGRKVIGDLAYGQLADRSLGARPVRVDPLQWSKARSTTTHVIL